MKRATGAGAPRAPRAPRGKSDESVPVAGGDPVIAALARVALDGAIVGHEAAQQTLGRALSSGHFPHAWIFHGPSGVGKCTLAMRVAALVVDPNTDDAARAHLRPLQNSRSAELLRAGTHPDTKVIRADLAGSSADRELRERKQINIPIGLLREHMIGGGSKSDGAFDAPVYRSSVLGAGKVFIIDEAERLEADGQNVLLKTLEEPPAGTVIILVTSSLEKLLPTIRSRCQRLALAPLSPTAMRAWLDANLGELHGPTRDFVELFAAGSPGVAVTAVELGLHEWHSKLVPMIDRLTKGECPLEMAEVMNELAAGVAEAAVKRDELASKDAANRRATGLLFAVIGAEVGRRLAASTSDSTRLAYWMRVPELIAAAESSIRANVNQKLVLADFVAQWSTLRVR